jgi:uncharacterized membrane protein YeiB
MLLFIALANAQFFLTGPDPVRTMADQVVALVQSTLVNGRAIALFALVFGYGMVRILERVRAQGGGWVHARVLLRRRGWVMLAIGFAHAALFLPVDIVGAYGLAIVLFVGLLRAKDATLLWTAGLVAAVSAALATALVVLMISAGGDGTVGAPSLSQEVFPLAVVERIQEWVLYTPITLLLVALPMILLGVWAGRRRVLEEPGRHRGLLMSTAVIGLGIAIATGLPDALVTAHLAPGMSPLLAGLLAVTHDLGGWAGGLGWASVLALVALRLEERERRGPVVRAVAAVGERSLTCYLTQSVVFSLVFAPYAAGLGATLGVTGAAAVAVATWTGTVVLAEVLRRAGRRGPAEVLLRRLTYAGTGHAPTQ